MAICLERGADLHMTQLMPLPLTVSCSSKIQIGFTFLVLAHLGSPGQRAVKRVRVGACVYYVCDLSYLLFRKPRPPQCSLARVPKVTPLLKILDAPMHAQPTLILFT